MNFKKTLRLLAWLMLLVIACIVPVPITFTKKDKLPKYLIEQIDTKDEDENQDDIKELF